MSKSTITNARAYKVCSQQHGAMLAIVTATDQAEAERVAKTIFTQPVAVAAIGQEE